MKKVSLIIPCYNEEAALPIFYHEVIETMPIMMSNLFAVIIFLIQEQGHYKRISI